MCRVHPGLPPKQRRLYSQCWAAKPAPVPLSTARTRFILCKARVPGGSQRSPWAAPRAAGARPVAGWLPGGECLADDRCCLCLSPCVLICSVSLLALRWRRPCVACRVSVSRRELVWGFAWRASFRGPEGGPCVGLHMRAGWMGLGGAQQQVGNGTNAPSPAWRVAAASGGSSLGVGMGQCLALRTGARGWTQERAPSSPTSRGATHHERVLCAGRPGWGLAHTVQDRRRSIAARGPSMVSALSSAWPACAWRGSCTQSSTAAVAQLPVTFWRVDRGIAPCSTGRLACISRT